MVKIVNQEDLKELSSYVERITSYTNEEEKKIKNILEKISNGVNLETEEKKIFIN